MPAPPAIRPYAPADLPAVMALYHDTIHRVNRRDYSAEQVAAWAPGALDADRWRRKLAGETVAVAEVAGDLAGFCSWDASGYLDLLYVHHAHQRRGVAAALYAAAEADLRGRGVGTIHTHASITARPFFESRGFAVVRPNAVEIRGVVLANFVMEKPLPPRAAGSPDERHP